MAAQEADFGPYRLRSGQDAVWPPVARAYGGTVDTLWRRWSAPLLGLARLILPVSLTVILLGAAYLYGDAALPVAGTPRLIQNALLTMGDLILPMAWMSIHLTNRRYGAVHALAQLCLALGICALVMLLNPYDLDDWVTMLPALTGRALAAFGIAFLIANFVGILVFDGARGPRWWTAPLMGSLAVSLVYSAIFYPAAFAGVYPGWTDSAWVHDMVFFLVSVALLIPYRFLRAAMRPQAGLNGY